MTSEFDLFKNIINLSESKTWDQAKNEWTLKSIEYLEQGEDYEICICGKEYIRCVCTIHNIKNQNEAKIGRCCINKIFYWAIKFVTLTECNKYQEQPK